MNYPEKARRVIDLEIEELQRLRERIGDPFSQTIQRIMETLNERRKLVVCGVGKSGNIGRKLAATLNSTGATTVLLNAQDALPEWGDRPGVPVPAATRCPRHPWRRGWRSATRRSPRSAKAGQGASALGRVFSSGAC